MSVRQIAAVDEDVRLQFARQIYDKCLERHGENHEQTRLAMEYLSGLENRGSLSPREMNRH
jgi:hypothetical protein